MKFERMAFHSETVFYTLRKTLSFHPLAEQTQFCCNRTEHHFVAIVVVEYALLCSFLCLPLLKWCLLSVFDAIYRLPLFNRGVVLPLHPAVENYLDVFCCVVFVFYALNLSRVLQKLLSMSYRLLERLCKRTAVRQLAAFFTKGVVLPIRDMVIA